MNRFILIFAVILVMTGCTTTAQKDNADIISEINKQIQEQPSAARSRGGKTRNRPPAPEPDPIPDPVPAPAPEPDPTPEPEPDPVPTPDPGPTSDIEFPTGIFASSPDKSAMQEPNVVGALIRVKWNQIEKQQGVYDFADLEKQLDKVRDVQVQWALGIIGGSNTPLWIGDERFDFLKQSETLNVPTPWDENYLEGLGKLMSAVAEKYGDDPDLALVYVPQISANGIEGFWPTQTTPDMDKLGYTKERHAQATLDAVEKVSSAFPDKAIALELHEVNGSTDVPEMIISGLDANQVGLACWWLGQGTYLKDLQAVFAKFSGAKYGQIIAADIDESASNSRYRLVDYNGVYWGLDGVYQMAQDMGISYVEPWPRDLNAQPEAFDDWVLQ